MKKIFVLTALISFVFCGISAFRLSEKQTATIIEERQQKRLEHFSEALLTLQNLVVQDDVLDRIKSQYLTLRRAFKEWEYLAEYTDPILVKDKINGVPLKKIERNTFGLNVVEPRGLQVLDELIFGDTSFPKKEILVVISDLKDVLNDVRNIRYPIYDRVVFEASRTELIRLFTLGLTGFDVPSSNHSIEDAVVVLNTLRDDLSLYKQFFKNINQVKTQQLFNILDQSIVYLGQSDFDHLDRLKMLKEYVNPMFQILLFFHKESGVETIQEVSNFLPPLNLSADNIFSADLLDATRYIGLPRSFYTPKVIALGKTLFYDPILSSNNQRSCASCHHPNKAFTDGQPKSIALGQIGTVNRNAPTLINCVYSERFFHDLRAEALEDQIEHVLVNEKEFNTTVFAMLSKLKKSEDYQALFQECFVKEGKEEVINHQNVAFAISAFVTSLKSWNSPFDLFVRGVSGQLPESAKRGFNLFMGKAACGTCHYAPIFNGTVPPRYEESESEVLGVPEDPNAILKQLDPDLGRASAKLKEQAEFYNHSFKTPTIRNIALTAPYMHNGVYKTLEEVMDFYNQGGGLGMGIQVPNQTLSSDSLHLTQAEISDIISFMKTLTDTSQLTSKPKSLPKFSQYPEWNKRKIGGLY